MTPIKCFLIEPVLVDEPRIQMAVQHLVVERHESWTPVGKIIRGWKHAETGEVRPKIADWHVGAMWYALWMPKKWCWENETGPHLLVHCPNPTPDPKDVLMQTRDWDLDCRASNCTLPNDHVHRCWIRTGNAPDITVAKNGLTCSAGAGSIALPNWHGFLERGYLVENRNDAPR